MAAAAACRCPGHGMRAVTSGAASTMVGARRLHLVANIAVAGRTGGSSFLAVVLLVARQAARMPVAAHGLVAAGAGRHRGPFAVGCMAAQTIGMRACGQRRDLLRLLVVARHAARTVGAEPVRLMAGRAIRMLRRRRFVPRRGLFVAALAARGCFGAARVHAMALRAVAVLAVGDRIGFCSDLAVAASAILAFDPLGGVFFVRVVAEPARVERAVHHLLGNLASRLRDGEPVASVGGGLPPWHLWQSLATGLVPIEVRARKLWQHRH